MAKSSYVWSGSEWIPVASAIPQVNQRGIVDTASTSYTLGVDDTGKAILFGSSSSVTLTIPKDLTYDFNIGQTFLIVQNGTGSVSVTVESPAVLHSSVATETVALNQQYSVATLIKVDSDEWVIYGDIVSP